MRWQFELDPVTVVRNNSGVCKLPRRSFAVLPFADIIGSTDLKERYGVPTYSVALVAHNGVGNFLGSR